MIGVSPMLGSIKLAIKILSQPFFDNLRTKNQLGYIVKFSFAIFHDSYYICEKIQSSKPTDFVKNKINEFNVTLNECRQRHLS